MTTTGILVILAAVFSIVWLVLHVVMIVQGFKSSIGWGLVSLFVPLGSVVFAFARSGRKILAAALLVSMLGAAACGAIASYLTAAAAAEAALLNQQGMQEFDKQIEDLGNLEDLKL